jgi:CRISPR-associated protein Csm1
MAEEINLRFRAWTCFNPAVSLSGGIVVVPDNFPVLKAAQYAATAEHAAKEHKLINGTEKNAFTILDTPLNWEVEYPFVKLLKQQVFHFLEKKRLPQSFISKLHAHFANSEIREGKIMRMNVLWMMAYDFTRLASSINKNDQEARQFVIDIKDWIFTNRHTGFDQSKSKYHIFELINLAARWAELELRTNKL